MEPLVFEIASLLNSTFSPDNLVLDSTTQSLLTLSLQQPAAPLALLSITTGHYDQGLKIAAATFLKNFTNRLLDQRNATIDYRNQLAQALLLVEPPVFRVLVEAFRSVVVHNFVKDNSWPQLVHDLKSAIQSSDIFNGGAYHPWKTLSALSILQTVVRPFQYFLDAKLAKEPVPPQLEQLAVHILVPLISTLHSFVDKVMPAEARTNPDIEKVILIICKCIYFSVRSHMPAAIAPQLPCLCRDLFRILDSLPFDDISQQDQNALRFKSGKRILLIFCALVSRHRKHADRLMEDMVHCSIRIVKHSSTLCNLDNLSERVISLAYDVISHILETGPGWRLVSSHFPVLLECAIFPALKMNQKDALEWEEDADEYLRKNLPSDLEEISGWRNDLFTARKSANNLLGLISISKGPSTGSYNTKGGAAKRKKGVKCKNKEQCRSVGELLVMPFLSKFPTPVDYNTLPEALNDYYGVLMAYGGLEDFLKNKDSEHTMSIVRNRVLPLYASSAACPYLLASANWILGELASCLPKEMNADVYSSLLKSLVMPNIGSISCYPVRISSAGAISALLENDYLPIEWSPLLQVLVNNVGITEENESAILFELLATTVEVGGESVAMHIPMVVTALAGIIEKHLPPHREPWPQVVERGFGALRAMAQAWESSLPAESDQVELSQPCIFGWATITKCFAALLQKAWTMMEEDDFDNWHLPSCFDDVTVLLGNVIKFIIWTGTDVDLEIQKLLKLWAHMLADWHAWDEVEDMAMFDTIQDLINLHTKYGLRDFFLGSSPSPPAPPVPQCSILDCITSFVIEALSAHNSTVWRACLCFHILLNMKSFSPEAESFRQKLVVSFCLKAYSRLMEIRSKPVALWKPLLLVTSSCYLCYPDVVENILMTVDKFAFISWVGTLGYIISNHSGLFSSLQEVKLVVLTLAKVVERMVLAPTDAVRDALNDSFISLMKAVIRMKELQEKEEEDGTDEFDDEDDVDEDSENDDESENDDQEETEEEFLQRYAKTAEELENGLVTEGDEEDEARKLELGTMDEVDQYAVVFSLIERYGQVFSGLTMPSQIVKEFVDLCPEFEVFFKAH